MQTNNGVSQANRTAPVPVTVRADSPEGFDKGKLQNGVLEPLRESDLIKDRWKSEGGRTAASISRLSAEHRFSRSPGLPPLRR